MRHLLALCLVLATTIAHSETYRWSDASGHTVVSDLPPTGNVKGLVTAGGKAEVGDGLSFALRKAVEAFPVTLYTSANCDSECKQARDLLSGRGVPFTEKPVQSPEDVAELKQLVGDTFVPSLKVGNQHYRGLETGAYNNLLDLAGYPKTAPFGSNAAKPR